MLLFFVNSITASLPLVLLWSGLLIGALRRDGRHNGRTKQRNGHGGVRLFAATTVAGVVAAVTTTVWRQAVGGISRELISLATLPLAVLLGAAALIWVWRPVSSAWGYPVIAVLAGLVVAVGLPDVLLLATGLVPAGASALTSGAALNLCGYALGLGVVGLSVWAATRASAGPGVLAARVAASAVLILGMVSQLTALARILIARRMIDVPHWGFQVVVWLVNASWVVTAGLALAALAPVVPAIRAGRHPASPPANPAEQRLRRAATLSRRRFLGWAVAGFGVTALAVTVGRSAADARPQLSPPEASSSDAQDVWVQLAAIDDGHLHRFAYTAANGTQVRFIAIRKMANSFVAALDACNICGPAGYYEQGGRVICRLCGVAMNIATIGFKGGCNPIPVDYQVRDGRLIVPRSALEANAKVFA